MHLSVYCFVLTLFMVINACAPNQLYQRKDLDAALLKYHQSFRWGRLKQAAQYVQPQLQADFVQNWLKHWDDMELHNVEVLSLIENENGDVVEVAIKVQWIDQTTMNLKEKILQETWVRTKDGWLLAGPVFPKDLLNQ